MDQFGQQKHTNAYALLKQAITTLKVNVLPALSPIIGLMILKNASDAQLGL